MTMQIKTKVSDPMFVEVGETFMRLAGRRAASERFDVIVIGGGQAGLSVGYHLKQQGVRFVILDASERVGDAWRKRWDSLRLFTPAWLDSLDGLPFPGPRDAMPTKDQMADYLEAYAAHFELPVRTKMRVERLTRNETGLVVQAGGVELTADQVIIAMASYQHKRTPAFARELRADVVQMHSSEYKNPGQLRPGSVAIIGGGNSGAEIARELSTTHRVIMSGPQVGEVPVRMDSWFGRMVFVRFLMRVVFHHLLTIRTPFGRKARPKMMHKATPLIRVKTADLAHAGVERTGRVASVCDGLAVTDEGRTLDVQNVIWCTGYAPSTSFVELPIFDESNEPMHEAGVVTREPGLYFVGLPFLYSMSSSMIHGVGRDARRIARLAAERCREASARSRLLPGTEAVERVAY